MQQIITKKKFQHSHFRNPNKYTVKIRMEKIINNSGLQHLAENVFWNLDAEDLKHCAQINQSCKKILQNPIFCLRKFEQLSTQNRKDWIKVFQSVTNSDKGIAIISYLKWKMKRDGLVDLPCYTSPYVQNDFLEKILFVSCEEQEFKSKNQKRIWIMGH